MLQTMVKPHRNQPPLSSGLSSFWNTCGNVRSSCSENSQQYWGCAPGMRPDYIREYTDHDVDDDDDDDDSIVEAANLRHQEQGIYRIPQQPIPATHRVRSIVDGFIAPFIHCVQPPIPTCLTHADSWDPAMDNRNGNAQIRGKSSQQHYVVPSQTKYIAGNVLIHQTLTPTSVVGVNPPTKTSLTSSGSVHISPNDVLCGRGNSVNKHIGNVRFRELIAANQEDYPTLTKKEKMNRAGEIVNLILHHTDPPGRFVARDTDTGLWHDIGMPRSLEKVSQALRDKILVAADNVAATSSHHVERVAGTSDGNEVVDDIEVTAAAEPLDGSSMVSFSRATTITVNNHRNSKSLPPPILVPEHLRNVYKKEPIRLDVPSKSLLPPTYPITSPAKSSAHLKRQPHLHETNPGLVIPTIPPQYLPAMRGPIPISSSDSKQKSPFIPASPPFTSHVPPTSLPTIPITPRRTVVQYQNTPTLSSILVTPLAKNCDHQVSSSSRLVKPINEPCTSPLVEMNDEPQSRSTIWNDDIRLSGPKSPIFPSDVFQNPNYDTEGRNTSTDTQFRWNELLHDENGNVAISPSRQQSYPKRQRMSKNLLDISFDSTFLEVDTSMESIETDIDTPMDMDVAVASDHSAGAITTTHRLVEAIGSQLRLDDKVLRSPSELVQTLTRGRSRRKIEPLPRPCKATAPLDISADSMDGLAALSTAVFLRLDESF